jgi:hypothetical protein
MELPLVDYHIAGLERRRLPPVLIPPQNAAIAPLLIESAMATSMLHHTRKYGMARIDGSVRELTVVRQPLC